MALIPQPGDGKQLISGNEYQIKKNQIEMMRQQLALAEAENERRYQSTMQHHALEAQLDQQIQHGLEAQRIKASLQTSYQNSYANTVPYGQLTRDYGSQSGPLTGPSSLSGFQPRGNYPVAQNASGSFRSQSQQLSQHVPRSSNHDNISYHYRPYLSPFSSRIDPHHTVVGPFAYDQHIENQIGHGFITELPSNTSSPSNKSVVINALDNSVQHSKALTGSSALRSQRTPPSQSQLLPVNSNNIVDLTANDHGAPKPSSDQVSRVSIQRGVMKVDDNVTSLPPSNDERRISPVSEDRITSSILRRWQQDLFDWAKERPSNSSEAIGIRDLYCHIDSTKQPQVMRFSNQRWSKVSEKELYDIIAEEREKHKSSQLQSPLNHGSVTAQGPPTLMSDTSTPSSLTVQPDGLCDSTSASQPLVTHSGTEKQDTQDASNSSISVQHEAPSVSDTSQSHGTEIASIYPTLISSLDPHSLSLIERQADISGLTEDSNRDNSKSFAHQEIPDVPDRTYFHRAKVVHEAQTPAMVDKRHLARDMLRALGKSSSSFNIASSPPVIPKQADLQGKFATGVPQSPQKVSQEHQTFAWQPTKGVALTPVPVSSPNTNILNQPTSTAASPYLTITNAHYQPNPAVPEAIPTTASYGASSSSIQPIIPVAWDKHLTSTKLTLSANSSVSHTSSRVEAGVLSAAARGISSSTALPSINSSSLSLSVASYAASNIKNSNPATTTQNTPLPGPSISQTPSRQSNVPHTGTFSRDGPSKRSPIVNRAYVLIPEPPDWLIKDRERRKILGKRKRVDSEFRKAAPGASSQSSRQLTMSQREQADILKKYANTRTQKILCKWRQCGAILYSVELLAKHLHSHNPSVSFDGKEVELHSVKCLWAGCHFAISSAIPFFSHVELHTSASIFCPYEECDNVSNDDYQLLMHVDAKHRNSNLKPVWNPFEPLSAPASVDTVSQLPAHMVIARKILPRRISNDRHITIGPRILRKIFAPVQIAKRYNAARKLKSGGRADFLKKGTGDYEFLDMPATYSSNLSKPAKLDMMDLTCEDVSQLVHDGLVLWKTPMNCDADGQNDIDDSESDPLELIGARSPPTERLVGHLPENHAAMGDENMVQSMLEV